MQILNFTEPLIKPALQDRSKCFTIRKAWDWLGVGNDKKACWREQMECRHKVGALEQIMWMQSGKNDICGNCARFVLPDICGWNHWDKKPGDTCTFREFSKVFGVGNIVSTKKIWMYNDNEHIQIKADRYVLDLEECDIISEQDGFKSYIDFCEFFIKHYPILSEGWMPFWRIGWKWRVEL